MKKRSYTSGSNPETTTPGPSNLDNNVFGRGPSASEMTYEYSNSAKPEDDPNEDNPSDMTNLSEDDLINKLILLSDVFDSDDKESYANFTDFLIKKFASVKNITNSTDLFNSLIVKINRADISDTNKVIKNLAKIYSRTVVLEYSKNKDLNKSKESAYKKTLHRANQYLSEE